MCLLRRLRGSSVFEDNLLWWTVFVVIKMPNNRQSQTIGFRIVTTK